MRLKNNHKKLKEKYNKTDTHCSYLNSHISIFNSISLKVKHKTIIIMTIITNKYYYSVVSFKR